ncbi:hypothetical protein [Nostoc sp. JL23]|nr:hypothetical protein [Nostoc sp. JL23]
MENPVNPVCTQRGYQVDERQGYQDLLTRHELFILLPSAFCLHAWHL